MSADDEFERLLTTARADDATRSRAAVGALRELAAEDASIVGLLADLGDRRAPVRVIARGAEVAGAVVAVASGGVALAGESVLSMVRLAAIDVVTGPEGLRLDGDLRRVPDRPWIALVQDHVDRDDAISVIIAGSLLRGSVGAIGRDVLSLVAADGATTYVRTESIDVVMTGRPRSPSS